MARFLQLTLRRVFAAALAAAISVPTAQAQERGAPAEAVAMVGAVQALVREEGLAAASEAITNSDRFKDRDLYPFIYRLDGLSVAHGANPKMVGKSWIGAKDQDGNFLIQQMVAIVTGPGHGWYSYKWPDPLTHKIRNKRAYVEMLGTEYLVGVGIYDR